MSMDEKLKNDSGLTGDNQANERPMSELLSGIAAPYQKQEEPIQQKSIEEILSEGKTPEPGGFIEGVKSGIDVGQAGLYGALEVAGSLGKKTGLAGGAFEALQKFGEEGAARNLQEAGQYNIGDVFSTDETGNIRLNKENIAGNLGSAVGQLALMAIGGGVGGLGAKAIGMTAAKVAGKKAAERAALGTAEKIGAGATSIGMQTGLHQQTQKEETGGEADPWQSLIAGTAEGLIDTISAGKLISPILGRLSGGGALSRVAADSLGQRFGAAKALSSIAKASATEAVTEVAQSAIDAAALQFGTGKEGKDYFTTKEALTGFLNDFVVGGMAGGAIHGASLGAAKLMDKAPGMVSKEENDKLIEEARAKGIPEELVQSAVDIKNQQEEAARAPTAEAVPIAPIPTEAAPVAPVAEEAVVAPTGEPFPTAEPTKVKPVSPALERKAAFDSSIRKTAYDEVAKVAGDIKSRKSIEDVVHAKAVEALGSEPTKAQINQQKLVVTNAFKRYESINKIADSFVESEGLSGKIPDASLKEMKPRIKELAAQAGITDSKDISELYKVVNAKSAKKAGPMLSVIREEAPSIQADKREVLTKDVFDDLVKQTAEGYGSESKAIEELSKVYKVEGEAPRVEPSRAIPENFAELLAKRAEQDKKKAPSKEEMVFRALTGDADITGYASIKGSKDFHSKISSSIEAEIEADIANEKAVFESAVKTGHKIEEAKKNLDEARKSYSEKAASKKKLNDHIMNAAAELEKRGYKIRIEVPMTDLQLEKFKKIALGSEALSKMSEAQAKEKIKNVAGVAQSLGGKEYLLMLAPHGREGYANGTSVEISLHEMQHIVSFPLMHLAEDIIKSGRKNLDQFESRIVSAYKDLQKVGDKATSHLLDKLYESESKKMDMSLVKDIFDKAKESGIDSLSKSQKKDLDAIVNGSSLLPIERDFLIDNKYMKDPHEILSWAMTNDQYSLFMQSVPSINPGKKSMFNDVFDALMKMFGAIFRKGERKVIEDIFDSARVMHDVTFLDNIMQFEAADKEVAAAKPSKEKKEKGVRSLSVNETDKVPGSDNVVKTKSVSSDLADALFRAIQHLPIDKFAKQIAIVSNINELPDALKSGLDYYDTDGVVRGMYDQATDTIYIFSDSVKNTDEMREVFAHEVTHRGFLMLKDAQTKEEFDAGLLRLNNKSKGLRDAIVRFQKEGRFSGNAPLEVKINETFAALAEEFGSGTSRMQISMIKSVFGQFKKLFRDMLTKAFGQKIADDFMGDISDYELINIVRLSYRKGFDEMLGPRITSERNGRLLSDRIPVDEVSGEKKVTEANAQTAYEYLQKLKDSEYRSIFGEAMNVLGDKFGIAGFGDKFGRMPGIGLLGGIQSPYHKSRKDESFRNVFENVQSMMSMEAAFAMEPIEYLNGSVASIHADPRSFKEAALDFFRQGNIVLRGEAENGGLEWLFKNVFTVVDEKTNKNILFTKDRMRKIPGFKEEYFAMYNGIRDAIASINDNVSMGHMKNAMHAMGVDEAVIDSLTTRENGERTIGKSFEVFKKHADEKISDLEQSTKDAKSQMSSMIGKNGEVSSENKSSYEALKALVSSNEKMANSIRRNADVIEKTVSLANDGYEQGYFPFSRFGDYMVSVFSDEMGDVPVHSEKFESITDARRAAEFLKQKHPNMRVTTGSVSKEMDAISERGKQAIIDLLVKHSDELIGTTEGNVAVQNTMSIAMDLASDAMSARNSFREHIINQRKAVSGMSGDVGRVISTFILSGSKEAARVANMGKVTKSLIDIPKEKGKIKDEAKRLVEYAFGTKEEFSKIRGLMYFWYIGGNLSSAFLQLTQPITMTIPTFSQFVGGKAASKETLAAMRDVMGNNISKEHSAILDRYINKGIISPQHVWMLMGVASNSLETTNKRFGAFVRMWGSFFAYSESINRQATAIAAIRLWEKHSGDIQKIIKERSMKSLKDRETLAGINSMDSFVEFSIRESQLLANKGNRPSIMRGGAAPLFTFKLFPISYVEFLTRLPMKDKAIALGILALLAGGMGLPFLDDFMDLIDTALQFIGYPANSKKAMNDAVAWIANSVTDDDDISKFITTTALFGLPSAAGLGWIHPRVGMQDLLPGTAMFKPSASEGVEKQVFEFLGVPGSFAKSTIESAKMVSEGYGGTRALTHVAPVALKNVLKAAEIGLTGNAVDTRGNLIVKYDDPLERFIAFAQKVTGIQPVTYAKAQTYRYMIEDQKNVKKVFSNRLIHDLALAKFNKDDVARREAVKAILEWNRSYPAGSEMKIDMKTLDARVAYQMNKMSTEALSRAMKSGGKDFKEIYRKAIKESE